MLDFPLSTEFNKRIPKQKFYENIAVTPAMKRAFVEQIRIIYWRNKIATTTLNLAAGGQVTESRWSRCGCLPRSWTRVCCARSTGKSVSHPLFAGIRGQVSCCHRLQGGCGGQDGLRVDRYYSTDWLDEDDLPVHLEGLTLDAVYENFVRQIAGDALGTGESASLKDGVEQQKQREQLEKQIVALEAKIRKEKQPKKKFEMVQMLNAMKDERERGK